MDVSLRPVEDADPDLFHAYEQDPEASRRAHFPARERDAFLTHWRTKILGNPTGRVRTVVADGRVAGNILAWWQDGDRWLGYWLGREFWGRGVGTAALRLFLDGELTRPLLADPHEENAGSVRLLEKCGFRRDSVDDDGHVLLILR